MTTSKGHLQGSTGLPRATVSCNGELIQTVLKLQIMCESSALLQRVSGDCTTSAMAKSGELKFPYPPNQLATSKLALGVLRGAQARAACGCDGRLVGWSPVAWRCPRGRSRFEKAYTTVSHGMLLYLNNTYILIAFRNRLFIFF